MKPTRNSISKKVSNLFQSDNATNKKIMKIWGEGNKAYAQISKDNANIKEAIKAYKRIIDLLADKQYKHHKFDQARIFFQSELLFTIGQFLPYLADSSPSDFEQLLTEIEFQRIFLAFNADTGKITTPERAVEQIKLLADETLSTLQSGIERIENENDDEDEIADIETAESYANAATICRIMGDHQKEKDCIFSALNTYQALLQALTDNEQKVNIACEMMQLATKIDQQITERSNYKDAFELLTYRFAAYNILDETQEAYQLAVQAIDHVKPHIVGKLNSALAAEYKCMVEFRQQYEQDQQTAAAAEAPTEKPAKTKKHSRTEKPSARKRLKVKPALSLEEITLPVSLPQQEEAKSLSPTTASPQVMSKPGILPIKKRYVSAESTTQSDFLSPIIQSPQAAVSQAPTEAQPASITLPPQEKENPQPFIVRQEAPQQAPLRIQSRDNIRSSRGLFTAPRGDDQRMPPLRDYRHDERDPRDQRLPYHHDQRQRHDDSPKTQPSFYRQQEPRQRYHPNQFERRQQLPQQKHRRHDTAPATASPVQYPSFSVAQQQRNIAQLLTALGQYAAPAAISPAQQASEIVEKMRASFIALLEQLKAEGIAEKDLFNAIAIQLGYASHKLTHLLCDEIMIPTHDDLAKILFFYSRETFHSTSAAENLNKLSSCASSYAPPTLLATQVAAKPQHTYALVLVWVVSQLHHRHSFAVGHLLIGLLKGLINRKKESLAFTREQNETILSQIELFRGYQQDIARLQERRELAPASHATTASYQPR